MNLIHALFNLPWRPWRTWRGWVKKWTGYPNQIAIFKLISFDSILHQRYQALKLDFFMVFMTFMVKCRAFNKDERHSFVGIGLKFLQDRVWIRHAVKNLQQVIQAGTTSTQWEDNRICANRTDVLFDHMDGHSPILRQGGIANEKNTRKRYYSPGLRGRQMVPGKWAGTWNHGERLH